jgi:hypothetical protein
LRPPSPPHVKSGFSFGGVPNALAAEPDSITTICHHVLVILDLEDATYTTYTTWNMYFMATFHSSVSSTASTDPSTPKEVDVPRTHID